MSEPRREKMSVEDFIRAGGIHHGFEGGFPTFNFKGACDDLQSWASHREAEALQDYAISICSCDRSHKQRFKRHHFSCRGHEVETYADALEKKEA